MSALPFSALPLYALLVEVFTVLLPNTISTSRDVVSVPVPMNNWTPRLHLLIITPWSDFAV